MVEEHDGSDGEHEPSAPRPRKAPRVAEWEVPDYRPTLAQLRWDDELIGCLLGLVIVAVLGGILLVVVGVWPSDTTGSDDLIVGFSLVLGSVFVTAICAAVAGALAPVLHSRGWRRTARGLQLSALIVIALPFVSCGGCFMWFSSKF
jgi:hypothetical protein